MIYLVDYQAMRDWKNKIKISVSDRLSPIDISMSDGLLMFIVVDIIYPENCMETRKAILEPYQL